MRNKKNDIERLLIIFCIIFFGFLDRGDCEPKQQLIIGNVDGTQISEKDIIVNNNTEREVFKAKYKREPSQDELAKEIIKAEQKKLISKIRSIVQEKYIKEHGITVTPDEVHKTFTEIYPGLKENPEIVLKKERVKMQQIYYALKEVNEHPERKVAIYQAMLKDTIDDETWQSLVKYYSTPNKLDAFKKGIPETVDDIYKSSEISMREWVLNKKFEKSITKDVSVSEEEINKQYDLQYANIKIKPKFEEVKPKIERELMNEKRIKKIERWWQDAYGKIKVEISDSRYGYLQDVLKSVDNHNKN